MAFVDLGQDSVGERVAAAEPEEPEGVVARRPDVAQGELFQGLFGERQSDGGRTGAPPEQRIVESLGHAVQVASYDGQEQGGVPLVRVTGVQRAVQGLVGVRGECAGLAGQDAHARREWQGVEVGPEPGGRQRRRRGFGLSGRRPGRLVSGHQRSPWSRWASFRYVMPVMVGSE
jgi:hypothetical protein